MGGSVMQKVMKNGNFYPYASDRGEKYVKEGGASNLSRSRVQTLQKPCRKP
jgi:hypothetical protein